MDAPKFFQKLFSHTPIQQAEALERKSFEGETAYPELSNTQIIPSAIEHEMAEKYREAESIACKIEKVKSIESFLKYYDILKSFLEFVLPYESAFQIEGTAISDRLAAIRYWRPFSLVSLYKVELDAETAHIAKLKTPSAKERRQNAFRQRMRQVNDPSFQHFLDVVWSGKTDYKIKPVQPNYVDVVNIGIAYYRNGYLYRVLPMPQVEILDDARDIAYSARYIFSDGQFFDLADIDSVSKMVTPTFRHTSGSFPHVTLNQAYILEKRAIRITDRSLAVTFIPIVRDMMKNCDIYCTYRTYQRLAEQLYFVGAIDMAEAFTRENPCTRLEGIAYSHLQSFHRQLEYCREGNNDLLQMDEHGATCSECAKYEGRVFSISGKDKRFPKLPPQVFKHGCLHPGCRHTFLIWPGEPDPKRLDDIIRFSNRPFVDNRTDSQKAAYEEYCKKAADEDLIWDLKREYYRLKYSGATDLPKNVYKYIDLRKSNL